MVAATDRALAHEFFDWLSKTIDEDGMTMPYGLIKDSSGGLVVMAMDLEPAQVYLAMFAKAAEAKATEAIFGLDRYTKPGQGTKYADVIAGHYFDGDQWHPFIIEYRPTPRIVEPIDWNNEFWNQALSREMASAALSVLDRRVMS
jgi:hypothetical protein